MDRHTQHPRSPRSRGALVYDKPPLTLDDLVERLAERGLLIPEPERTARYLRHIGYYRLSPYNIPFQHSHSDHVFREGTEFDDVLDRRARCLSRCSYIAVDPLAERDGFSTGAIEEAPLPCSRVAPGSARDCLAPQQLGTSPARTDQPSASDEPHRNGDS